MTIMEITKNMLKVMIATKTYTPMRYVLYDLYTLRHSNHPT